MRLVEGLWVKSSNGDWLFEETNFLHQESVVVNKEDTLESLLELIRISLSLGILTPVALTYQLPDWMILPEGPQSPPITLLTDRDVETMLSVSDYMTESVLYVTSGPELVAKYQFYCRSSFEVDGKLYLGEGVTEDQHRHDILG